MKQGKASENSPIDIVIMWVDGNDVKWRNKKNTYCNNNQIDGNKTEMFRDYGLLKYVFRGIEKFAPWVHHVFLVTDEQTPEWLNTAYEKVTIVDHKHFIPKEFLPVFNTNPIELNLYRIMNISEQYILFNDDMFIVNKMEASDFFQNKMPVEEGSLNGINGRDETFAGILFQDMSIMNRYYTIANVKKHLWKWLRLAYGKNLIRTLCLLPFQRLQGIFNPHGPMPILKETCKKVWDRDEEILAETCKHRFRTRFDVSGYVFRYDQLLSGNFIPRKSQNTYLSVKNTKDKIKRAFNKSKMICINDAKISEAEYLKKKEFLINLFETKFKEKSKYEK